MSQRQKEPWLLRSGATQVETNLAVAIFMWGLGFLLTDNILSYDAYAGIAALGFAPLAWFLFTAVIAIVGLVISWKEFFWGRIVMLLVHVSFWFPTGISMLANFQWSPAGMVFIVVALISARAFIRVMLTEGDFVGAWLMKKLHLTGRHARDKVKEA